LTRFRGLTLRQLDSLLARPIFLGMSWSSRLARPIHLDDGRTLRTLAGARKMLLALPDSEQRNQRWQLLAALLVSAARANHKGLLSITTARLEQALSEPPFGSVMLAPEPAEKPPAPSGRRRTARRTRACRT
jgi:hypothetical protein